MRKSRFIEAQIVGMIKEQQAGLPTAELCPEIWALPCDVLRAEGRVWRNGSVRRHTTEAA